MTKNFVSDALRAPLDKKTPPAVRAVLFALATAVFYLFAVHARYATIDEFSGYRTEELTRFTAGVFTAIFALSYVVQLRVGRSVTLSTQLLLAVITGAVLLAKISLLDYVSDDYEIFLSDWIYSYSRMGLKEGLGTYIGSDYAPPYLYLLLLISRVKNFPWQYLVKAVSVCADVLLAYAVMKLASLRLMGAGARLLVFHIVSVLPTVVFNGAYWGQCDAIYTAFCLLGLFLGMTRRPVRSMICFGVALSFKLQTVFFLPILLPLWLRKDIGLRHVLLIPAAYMGMMLPALWGGKSLHHVLTVYVQQAKGYNYITVNAPNLYQLWPLSLDSDTLYTMFSGMALALGFALLAAVCLLLCVKRERLNAENMMLACVLLLAGVPYFLPKMHERYTFGADVLSLATAAYQPRRIVLPLCFGLASYLAYTAGLPGDAVMELKWAALFQLAGIVLTAAELIKALGEPDQACVAEVKA